MENLKAEQGARRPSGALNDGIEAALRAAIGKTLLEEYVAALVETGFATTDGKGVFCLRGEANSVFGVGVREGGRLFIVAPEEEAPFLADVEWRSVAIEPRALVLQADTYMDDEPRTLGIRVGCSPAVTRAIRDANTRSVDLCLMSREKAIVQERRNVPLSHR
ncbi:MULTISPECIES: hypothetical protein [unclassified Thioalkalivibrio]|uniref:hypothetical protein n=1 Tax=unclassified Thioalkalivibrio TaxID=2621013 RepID=UPI00035D988C|nr:MULTISPECIES: hypothetical protein [unclassified Thioalkalivibrio]